jgi:CRP-like cAMP-binding protein
MPCDPSVFEDIPIFSLLDADERAVLAEQVDLRHFAPRQRIFRAGDPGDKAYVLLKGQVQVVLIDDDNQEVVIDAPRSGEIFGLMMSQNRQDAKDRLRSELDFAVNRKAEGEIIQLAAKLNRVEDRLGDLEEAVNGRGR